MTSRARSLIAAAVLGAAATAGAQPSPPPPDHADKVDAKALMQSGIRLLEAKDYLGALAVFKDAYARFPSAKILLNIGTTLTLLDRKVDAANAYQKYLDAPDTDPSKATDVKNAITELDHAVGRLEITVTPADAELQVNDGEWAPAPAAKLVRVPEGKFTVRARKPKFQTEAKSAQIAAGEKAAIGIQLEALPEDKQLAVAVPATNTIGIVDHPAPPPEEPRGKLGGVAIAHLDIPRGGGAALVGITYDVSTAFQVEVTTILGPTYGAYAGASYALMDGKARPYLAAGLPGFVSHGIRVGARAAGGVELVITRHLSLLAEVGAEVMLNPEDNILKAAFIPAVGAAGRL